MKHEHSRKHDHGLPWPDPPFHVVLVQPEIPPNTGNIARMCAATGCRLHLVEPMGFRLDDAKLRRAGLDYWDSIAPVVHRDWHELLNALASERLWLFSTGGSRSCFDAGFRPGDALVFGSETRGLPQDVLEAHPDRVLGIPIRTEHVRSLNLSTAAGIAVYEALRQFWSGQF